ncbi:hypothetical protein K239x_15660 [Planctomycetes bacterium K23_9]|uniref:Ice-binding protein C-terminal domain-containing protein n=2 Tax=Stieleria marina TaxID=1930275 RepID=A0A517NR62_9BACT|nr:hypothetical protein K239x_15660 [Planctomycetes bacterium K23_9]
MLSLQAFRPALVALAVSLFACSTEAAIVFNLFGQPGTFDNNSTAMLTVGGITATFDAGSDNLNSNAMTFGISDGNNTSANNGDAIGGNEVLTITFDQVVNVTQVVATNLSTTEQILATIGLSPQISLDDTGDAIDTFNFSSSNEVAVGQSFVLEASGGDYSLTSFSVTAVPEPASLGFLAIGGVVLLNRRRRSASRLLPKQEADASELPER